MSNKPNGFVFLALALLFGSCGHFCLKASNGFKRIDYVVLCYIMFALKIYFMAKAYSLMPLGIANALYSSAIILFTTFLGLMYYKETLNAYSATGIMCIVSGVALIQYNK